jgi:hypothetical protein
MQNPAHGLTRIASTSAFILSEGEPKVSLQGSNCCRASDESSFLGASRVVAIPITKKIGILITHSLQQRDHALSCKYTMQVLKSSLSIQSYNFELLVELHIMFIIDNLITKM